MRKHGLKRLRWLWVWLVQIAACLLLGGALSWTLWLGRVLYAVCMWGLMPLLGGVSAYWATKKGLLNYAAWIAPPLCQALGHMAVWFYPPSPGPVLVCVFVSIVGAAAGEVRLREQHKKQ